MKERIIQFGEGNFLRGFFDYFLDVLNKTDLYDGKAVVIQPRAGGKCSLLAAQDCKYNLYLRGICDGTVQQEHHYIESVSRAIDPYSDYNSFISLADGADFRFIVSNTTEAGIVFDESCKFDDKPCLSFPGKVTQLLYRRYKNNLPGFIFLPTELIDNNGDELKKCITKYAALWNLEASFIEWISNENIFANTLVDRIVTGYPNDIDLLEKHPNDKFLDTAELFHLWVIEGNFEDELPLQKAGFNVVWTTDVRPYKKIKVRILNGAHTSLFAGALLSGIETVGEAMQDETTSAFLQKCMNEEILPTIGENDESRLFAQHVFERFSNPFIQHKWRAIAMNSVSKYSVRVLPTLLEYQEKFGTFPKCLTYSLACLLYFYKNEIPNDSAAVINTIQNSEIQDILTETSLWGTDLSELTQYVTLCYNKIADIGAKETMKWILSE